MVAWPARIEREWPLLEKLLGSAPSRRILDLGSGTGEHARFLAAKGFEVTGIDASESMIERSRDEELPDGVEFLHGDIRDVGDLTDGTYGFAMSLGNTVPHLTNRADLDRFAGAVAARLLPGSPVLIQLLNYERIIGQKVRHLPLDFRDDPESNGEIVFIRLMDPREDGTVIFMPSSLRIDPASEEPLELVATRRVELHGWRRTELEDAFRSHGFERFEVLGAFDGSSFDPDESQDLLFIARKRLTTSQPADAGDGD